MRSILPVVVALCVMTFVAGCLEQEPAEISVICTLDGNQQGCTAQIYNSKGNQINEVSTDARGIGYIKNIAPGTYTLKFIDNQRNKYPAEVTVTVASGEALPVKVELNEAPAAPDAAGG